MRVMPAIPPQPAAEKVVQDQRTPPAVPLIPVMPPACARVLYELNVHMIVG
jgi:hypothetical protein